MNARKIARIEARGKDRLARITAIRDKIVADGRPEATDAEYGEVQRLEREVIELTAKLEEFNRG